MGKHKNKRVVQKPAVRRLTTSEAFRRLEHAHTVNARLEAELDVLRRMAKAVHHRDFVDAEKFYEEWVRTVDSLPHKHRVFSPEFKFHVVNHYNMKPDGEKYKVCEYYRIAPKTVLAWVAQHRRGGPSALHEWGAGSITPELKTPLPKKHHTDHPHAHIPEIPTKVVDKSCHIFLPERDWEEIP